MAATGKTLADQVADLKTWMAAFTSPTDTTPHVTASIQDLAGSLDVGPGHRAACHPPGERLVGIQELSWGQVAAAVGGTGQLPLLMFPRAWTRHRKASGQLSAALLI